MHLNRKSPFLSAIGCIACFALPISSGAASPDEEAVVSIDQEPSHRLVLEKPWIRAFDVSFPSQASSLWHSHEKDSVLICLDGADVPSEEPGRPPVARPPIASGAIYYRPYASQRFVHKIRNASPHSFRILDIEILTRAPDKVAKANAGNTSASQSTHSKIEHPNVHVVIDNERVRVTRWILKPSDRVSNIRINPHHLLVSLSDAEWRMGHTKPSLWRAKRGDLLPSDAESLLSISQGDHQGPAELAVIEVKPSS